MNAITTSAMGDGAALLTTVCLAMVFVIKAYVH